MKKKIFYVHTDFAKYMFECFNQNSIEKFGEYKILLKMLSDIKKITKNRMIIPTYNYDFGKKKIFNYLNDKSQIGSFSEFFRKKYKNNRSVLPFFSDCSNFIREKKTNIDIFPIGENSTFEYLFKNSGKIIFFGVDFSPTYIHYIESQIEGGPLYRYDKNFVGKMILNKKKIQKITVKMHVIPRGLDISYDLKKIEKDLKKNDILKIKKFKNYFSYTICDVKKFHTYALKKLKKDPFYFLKVRTKKILRKNKILKNRRFDINDFEKI